MTTIFNILVYVVFAFITSHIAKKSEAYISENNISPKSWDRYLTYFVIFFAVIGGLRWNVGSDCLSYIHWFKYQRQLYEIQEEKEYLWWWLVDTIRQSGFHWSFGLGICALIQIIFITKTLQSYRHLLIFMPFVFLGGRYWMDSMGAVRQMIVGCGFLWASRFIYEHNLLKYIAFIFLSALIHQSALILLPLYFLPIKINISNNRYMLIGVFFLCFIMGQTPAFKGLASYISVVADATNYEGYGTIMSETLFNGYSDEALKFGPMMLSYLSIAIFVIWFGNELKEKYAYKIHYIDLWFNLSYFYACAYFLICNLGHIFIRPLMYFSLFQMVMATILLYHLWSEYILYGKRQLITFIFCITIAVNTSWDVFKASGSQWETTTYKVFFLNKDQINRLGL